MRRLPEDKRQAILNAIRAGAGQRARADIAREFEVSPTMVGNIAADAGLTEAFVRTQTKKATEAKQIDLSARLIQQASRNAGVAEQILESFENMALDDWLRVSPHSRGIVLGILQDKAVALSPPDDDGREDRKSALADLFELMRAASNP
jgi:hypothetical protein